MSVTVASAKRLTELRAADAEIDGNIVVGGTVDGVDIASRNTDLTTAESNISTNTTNIAAKANIASPTFTGAPLSTTPSTSDNTTKIATTAYVKAQGYITSTAPETNDLSSAVTWANVPNANITQGSVTQHQAALTITESQISDLGTYSTATGVENNADVTDATNVAAAGAVMDTGNESIAGNKTFTENIVVGADNAYFTPSDDDVYTPYTTNQWHSAAPFGDIWHDVQAFNRNYTTTQYVSTDGTNFTSETLELGLFAQQDKSVYEVIGNGERAVRWKFYGVAYNVARYFQIASTYYSPAASCTVKIEISSDDSSWTEVHSSSGISFSAASRYYWVDPYVGNAGYQYVRVTIDKGDSGTKLVRLSSIKMLSQRLGDQGKGGEDQYPYTWDKNKNMTIGNDLTVVGGDITLNGTGRIQGIDTVSAGTDAANKTYVDNAVIANTDTQDLSISARTISLTDGGSVTVPAPTYASITGKPTTFAPSSHTHTFASLTSKPTTLSGYGITDAATSTQGSRADSAVQGGDSPSFANLTVTGNLTITGDIDSYNTTTLDVTDKTISVSKGGTAALADGAGLIVDRGSSADATILWDHTNSRFNVSNTIVANGVTLTGNQTVTDSTSTTSSTTVASATAVKAAYDRGSTGVTNAAAAAQTANGALQRSGGTMTGAITLSGAPSSNLHAATKAYVDGAVIANTDTQDLSIVGTTLSLTNSPDVTIPQRAVSDSTSTTSSTTAASSTAVKSAYDRGSTGVTNAASAQTTADAALPKAGGTMSGAIAMGNQDITGANNITASSLRCTNIVTNKVVKFDGTQLNDSTITDTGTLITLGANTSVGGTILIGGLTNHGATDGKFLVADSTKTVKFRTPSEVRTDIGAGTSNLALGTTSTRALRGDLVDAVNSTSTVQAATANAVKTAYDLADDATNLGEAALPKAGGTMTGNITLGSNRIVGMPIVLGAAGGFINQTSAQLATAGTNTVYVGSNSYGWNDARDWATQTVDAGTPTLDYTDQYCGIICPVALSQVSIMSQLKINSANATAQVKVYKGTRLNGATGTITLTEICSATGVSTLNSRWTNIDIVGTTAVAAGQLIVVGFGKTSTDSGQKPRFNFTLTGTTA